MPHLTADWMQMPATRAVVDALETARAGSVRFVGGCVRNTLMGRSVDDIDMATQLVPEAVMQALEKAGIRAIPTGLEHGTITALVDGHPFEITSLRRDVETDGRRAVVAFTEDWNEDAMRRDFRLNALYATPDGTLFDPTGGGLDDARAGRVIFIGDAEARLREDYLRILRFFRFNAWYGAEIDPVGLQACANLATGLEAIARERIWKELKKLLLAPAPETALEAMNLTDVFAQILPGPVAMDRLHDLRISERLVGCAPDPMLRLMALIERSASSIQATSQALRLSNEETARLTMWAADNLPEVTGMRAVELRATLFWHGVQAVSDRAMLSGQDVRDILAAIRAWRRPDFPINGDDALAIGLKGPQIGRALSRVAQDWVASDFSLEREALLARLADVEAPDR